jgi:type II secretory pathway component PulF
MQISFLKNLRRAANLNGFWSQRTSFYRDLADSLAKNEMIDAFIDGEIAISTNKKTKDSSRLAGLLAFKKAHNFGGNKIGESLSLVMPKNDGLALTTLSKSVNQPKALRELADSIDRKNEMMKIIKTALISPVILIPVLTIFVYVLATRVIPEFIATSPAEVWDDFFNAAVRYSSVWINQFGWIVLLLVALSLFWAFAWALPNMTSDWRYKMENATGWKRALWILVFPLQPIFKIYRDIQGTLLLGSLANLMQTGMLLPNALKLLAENAQPWMRKHLKKCIEHNDHYPNDFVNAFSYGVLPRFLLGRMASKARQQKAGFDATLVELGTMGMDDATKSVKKSTALLNAVLLLVLGSLLVFYYAGILSISSSNQDANSPTAMSKRAKGEKALKP